MSRQQADSGLELEYLINLCVNISAEADKCMSQGNSDLAVLLLSAKDEIIRLGGLKPYLERK